MKTVTVTVNPGSEQVALVGSARVTFVPGAPDAAASDVAIEPAEVVADGVSSAEVRVVLRDARGNPVPGRRVELRVTGDGLAISQPSAPTDADGAAVGSLTATTAGAAVVTAVADPGTEQVELATRPSLSVVAGPLDPTASTVTLEPAKVEAGQPAGLQVRLVDAQGNPLAGLKVESAASGGEVSPQVSVSGSAGEAQARVVVQESGTIRVRVIVHTADGPVTLEAQPQLVVE